MRLIDANALRRKIMQEYDDCADLLDIIDEQPAIETSFNTSEYSDGFIDGYKAGSNYRELGCEGCAFGDTEEWNMPCAKCKRNCNDYYRKPREVK